MCSVSDIQGIIFYCEYLGHLELVPFTNLQIWMKTCPDVLHKLQVICIPGQGHIQAEGQLDLQPENKNHTVFSSTYLLLNIVHPSLRLDDSGNQSTVYLFQLIKIVDSNLQNTILKTYKNCHFCIICNRTKLNNNSISFLNQLHTIHSILIVEFIFSEFLISGHQ